ncbi:MAG: hypothetical protein CNE99_09935 [OM182 bacterium MED-G24]|uniref:Uncharacterized protein n=1 Tax=OM182 bacterium MED-G24 TaxID=1986255 RepID=A0A2A5WIA4_9GAMM|nr:MAG: hypothetical protein CNE99_09935 [OM182 bacterium MED-G24]
MNVVTSTRWCWLPISLLTFALLIGVLTVLLDLLCDQYDRIEDVFEWGVALLIHLTFICQAHQLRVDRP